METHVSTLLNATKAVFHILDHFAVQIRTSTGTYICHISSSLCGGLYFRLHYWIRQRTWEKKFAHYFRKELNSCDNGVLNLIIEITRSAIKTCRPSSSWRFFCNFSEILSHRKLIFETPISDFYSRLYSCYVAKKKCKYREYRNSNIQKSSKSEETEIVINRIRKLNEIFSHFIMNKILWNVCHGYRQDLPKPS